MTTSSTKPCPICRKPRQPDHHPFCSQRCKDRDLARWFSDSYNVPGPPAEPEAVASNDWREQD
ncbi:MAG: DNA gyrase inhibitor YacG [Alphaproteobacteria bacterium HGW-Alphaproteobacteria-14]|nr:MAG: DNA gyrase inhibitor YacG [Alphaproteobacteria bacterium HGW-Alphaproteobacteria-14]